MHLVNVEDVAPPQLQIFDSPALREQQLGRQYSLLAEALSPEEHVISRASPVSVTWLFACLPRRTFLEERAGPLVSRFNHHSRPTVRCPDQLDLVMLLLEGLHLLLLSFVLLQLYLNLFAIDNAVVRIIIHFTKVRFTIRCFLLSLRFFGVRESVFKRLVIRVDLYLTAYPVVPDDRSLLSSEVEVVEESIRSTLSAGTTLRASRPW